MAETRSTRFGLPSYSVDTDAALDRSDWEEVVTRLEERGAILLSGTRAARPAPGTARRLYRADDENIVYYDDGAAWFTAGVSDHGQLAGNADDDHTQYLNTARHDVTARHGAGVVDHGSIGGLGDDDHALYLNPARHGAHHGADVASRVMRKMVTPTGSNIGASTAETTLHTKTIPNGILGATGEILALFAASSVKTNGAGTTTLRVKFGGTTIATHALSVGEIVAFIGVRVWILNTATNAQTYLVDWLHPSSIINPDIGTLAIDTTASQVLALTGQQSTTTGHSTTRRGAQVRVFPTVAAEPVV